MLPEEITKFVGQSGEVSIFEVEKGAIRRFAQAIDDRNPLYYDEEYARNARYGSIIAPPGFFGWPAKRTSGNIFSFEVTRELGIALKEAGYGRVLDGGIEYEFFCPVRAGDTLAALPMIKSIVGREGRTGKMAFVIMETTFTNQNGDLVAKARRTAIHR